MVDENESDLKLPYIGIKEVSVIDIMSSLTGIVF
jgi:hypothetical protein